jgi:hypothetical protein
MGQAYKGKNQSGRRAPFVTVPLALLDDPKVDPAAIATYAALQSYCDFGSEEGAFVTDNKASVRAHLGVRTFRDRRMLLRDLGWVDWDSGKEEGRSNTYRVHQVGSAPDAEGGRQEMPTPTAPDADPSSLYTESQVTGDKSVNLPVIRRGGFNTLRHADVMRTIGEVEKQTNWRATVDQWETMAVLAIFAYWVAVTGKDNARVRLSSERAFVIKARLREAGGGTPDAVSCLMYAIDGALKDPRLVQEKNGIAYLEVDNIFRNWSRVERCAHHCQGYLAGKEHKMVRNHDYLRGPGKPGE